MVDPKKIRRPDPPQWMLEERQKQAEKERARAKEVADQTPPQVINLPSKGRPQFLPCSDVIPRPTNWIWPGRIPEGKLTLIAGEPGIGKSMMVTDLLARWTAGGVWPDGSKIPEPGHVICLMGEDFLGDTVLPRLLAAGGDPGRMTSFDGGLDLAHRFHPLTFPRHLDELASLCDYVPRPRLIVLDPLAAFMGPSGDWGAEMQPRLAGLISLAKAWKVAIIGITHRDLAGRGTAGRRSGSALSLLACCRAAHQVSADRREPNLRRVAMLKNNVGPLGAPMAFRIVGETIQWQAEAAAVPAVATELEMACQWLTKALAGGPVLAKDLERQAGEALFSRMTVRRAAREIGVTSSRDGFQGPWKWSVSDPMLGMAEGILNGGGKGGGKGDRDI